MTTPSPYEQGFRDALLTAKALCSSFIGAPTTTSEEAEGGASIALQIDQLIDQKNHDLWSLFAVARADLSQHPEAEALRLMLRAPTGVLIDSTGRMLFLRLQGVEYDTGVLELMEENEKLEDELGALQWTIDTEDEEDLREGR